MTTQQAIDRVKFNLGSIKGIGSRIELNEEDLSQLINMSLDELVEKVDTPTALLLQYQPVLNVKKYRIARVDNVLRSEPPYGVTSGVGLDPFYTSSAVLINGSPGTATAHSILQLQAAFAARAMAQNTVQAELVWFFDKYKQTLMISFSGTQPSYVTVIYRPEINCVEDLPSNTWTAYLIRLATAHGKCIIGRNREKYSVQGSPVTVNSAILAEGQTELKEIYDELKPLTGRSIL